MFALFALIAHAASPPPGGFPPPPHDSSVASVYDGDTVTLVSGDKIRLRWVNTPELKPPEAYGLEARAATEQFVSGRRVHLLLGSENPRDAYGRVISGLVTSEGNLSVHLLELGLAHLFVIPPDDTDLTEMVAAQDRARAAHRGIWSTDRYSGTLHITSFHANAPGDDHDNVNGEYLRVSNIAPAPVNLDGYRVSNAAGQSWTFPALTIPVGHTVKVHSGRGATQNNPAEQLEVFLGSASPIWNNNDDTATILDRFGQPVDVRVHHRKRSERR